MYQVWDKDNVNNQNDKRSIFYVTAKKWVNAFMKRNKNLKKENKPLFTPTTIMETADEVEYAIVIHKAYFDRDDHIVFTVSTKEIQLANNCSKKLIKIPCGKITNMRFDIDNFLTNMSIKQLPAGRTARTPNACFLQSQLSFEQALYSLDSERKWYIDVGSIPRSQLEIGKDYFIDSNGRPYTYLCCEGGRCR
jgi:hypothetical protein